MWARQLYRRIELPMKFFQEKTKCLESPDAKKHIKNYNKLASTLLEYELLWHQSWFSVVDETKSGLYATLLVDDNQGEWVVNFDDSIMHLIKETRAIQRLGLEIPESAKQLYSQEEWYRDAVSRLRDILAAKKRIVDRLNVNLRKALSPHLEKLNAILEPGLTALNW
jgi:dynein heavy chain